MERNGRALFAPGENFAGEIIINGREDSFIIISSAKVHLIKGVERAVSPFGSFSEMAAFLLSDSSIIWKPPALGR